MDGKKDFKITEDDDVVDDGDNTAGVHGVDNRVTGNTTDDGLNGQEAQNLPMHSEEGDGFVKLAVEQVML